MENISGVVENLRIEKGYQDLIFSKTDLPERARISAARAFGCPASARPCLKIRHKE
jgi:hypothetical protein